jgi:hypothetical protein
MEKNTFMNLSVRNSQLVGYALLNLSSLMGVFFTLLGLVGVLTADDIPHWVGVFNESLFAVCNLVAYLVLGKIAVNLPTRNVMKHVGIFLFFVAILSVAFRCYRINHELSPMEFSVFNALFFVLETPVFLYLFGVIVRNNPTCQNAKLAINVIYWVSFISASILLQIIVPLFNFRVGLDLLDIIKCLTWMACSYVLFTSEVFSGQINTDPAPKGAYRFWNKYLTWYLVTILGSTILMTIIL